MNFDFEKYKLSVEYCEIKLRQFKTLNLHETVVIELVIATSAVLKICNINRVAAAVNFKQCYHCYI